MSEDVAEAGLPATLTPTRIWAIGEAMRIIRLHLHVAAKLILFGSSATGRVRDGSDLDIAIDAGEPLDWRVTGVINEALENSTIPYYVDVVDLDGADSDFVARVRREGIEWPS